MKRLSFLIFSILFALRFFAQAPGIQWAIAYGTTGTDNAHFIQQTTDSGYVIAGVSGGFWIVKTDATGNIQWQKPCGAPTAIPQCIKQTTDKGYIVAGSSGPGDYCVVKLDIAGNIQWVKTYGGTRVDAATAVQQTTDGGYIVVGYTYSNDGDVTGFHGSVSYDDWWVVKLDSAGNLQWQKCYGGGNYDEAYCVEQTPDGGYIVGGGEASTDGDVTGNHGFGDAWLVKIDSLGVIQWQRSYGGTDGEAAASVALTYDGGYFFSGGASSNDGDVSGVHGAMGAADYWAVRIDSIGNLLWQKCYGGTGTDYSGAPNGGPVGGGMSPTSDKGFILSGTSDSNDGDVIDHTSTGAPQYDYWLVKIDSVGAILWTKSLGGTSTDVCGNVVQTFDGGYAVIGGTISTDGDVTGNNGSYDYWAVKLQFGAGVDQGMDLNNISLYPNPASEKMRIDVGYTQEVSLKLIDAIGRERISQEVYSVASIDLSDLESGIYCARISSGSHVLTKKIVIQH